METRSGMSVIKSKVRLSALLWREFTASQMVEITGLKPESVRTELQRMKAEGLLEVSRAPLPANQKRKRGGQPVIYRLSSDPEKRLTLSRSVEAFYPEVSQPQRPTSRHFALATRLLDRGSTEKDTRQREQLLVEAEEELDFALAEEDASRAPEAVRAHIEFQRGRLAYFRGLIERAEVSLQKARQVFDAIGQSHQVALVDEFLLCIGTCRSWAAGVGYKPRMRAQYILEALNVSGFRGGPLTYLLADLLDELLQATYHEVFAAASEQAVAAANEIRQTAIRLSQHEQWLALKIESQEWRGHMRAPESPFPAYHLESTGIPARPIEQVISARRPDSNA